MLMLNKRMFDYRLDQEKHAIKCLNCEEGRPVDIVEWKLYGPCTNCCYRRAKEDKKQVVRYKEMYQLIMESEPGGEDVSKMDYDDFCEWCVGEMEKVFSAG